MNVSHDIKRIHVDAIATQEIGDKVFVTILLYKNISLLRKAAGHEGELTNLSPADLKAFVTSPLARVALVFQVALLTTPGVLQMSAMVYHHFKVMGVISSATRLVALVKPQQSAAILGGIFLVLTGIGSWRTMVGCFVGAFLSATLLNWGAGYFGAEGGAWNARLFLLS